MFYSQTNMNSWIIVKEIWQWQRFSECFRWTHSFYSMDVLSQPVTACGPDIKSDRRTQQFGLIMDRKVSPSISCALYSLRPLVPHLVCVCHFRNVKHQPRAIKSSHNHHHHRIEIWIYHERECKHINCTRIAASSLEF